MKIHSYKYLMEKSKNQRTDDLLSFLDGKISEQTLIVWDLDYTLIGPKSEVFALHNISSHRDVFLNEVRNLGPLRNNFLNYLCYKEITIPNDFGIKPLFKKIHAQNCHTVALSSMTFKPIFELSEPHKSRLKLLNDAGIYFSNQDESKKKDYLLYKGMILSDSVMEEGKAQSLKDYIKRAEIEPKTIVYIDDNTDNYIELSKYLGTHFQIIFFEYLNYFDPKKTVLEKAKFSRIMNQEIQLFKAKSANNQPF